MGLLMGKSPQQELERVRDFFDQLEEVNEQDEHIEKLGELVSNWLQHPTFSIERILTGYQVLVENACDPTLDHLDFKPEIKQAIEAFNKSKQVEHESDYIKLTDEQVRILGIEIITAIKADVYSGDGSLTMDEVRENFVTDVVNLTGEWEEFARAYDNPQDHPAIKKLQADLYKQADFVARYTVSTLNKMQEGK